MDYLSYYLIKNDVLPLRITCGKPYHEYKSFLDHFYVKLRTTLKKEVRILDLKFPEDIEDMEIDDQIQGLCQTIIQRRKGIIVFMDDYHKHRDNFTEIIYDFLGSLQILKDNLTRANLPVGFVVSALPKWVEDLPSNTQMSGFFDSQAITMPLITPTTIAAVLNQRIMAFCYDTCRREISPKFIESLFNQIGQGAGYREYIIRITTELESNNFAIVNTPIKLHEDELLEIKNKLEDDPAIAAQLSKLIYGSKFKKFTEEQITKCLELLVQTYLQGGVRESDVLFLDNKHYFLRLRDTMLIQKQKVKSDDKETFQWVVHKKLRKIIDEIESEYKRGISDYLLKIYGKKAYEGHDVVTEDGETTPLKSIRSFFYQDDLPIPESAKNSLQEAFQLYDSLINPFKQHKRPIIERASQAIDYLFRAFFEVDGSLFSFKSAEIEDLMTRWRTHWFDDESLNEFFKRVEIFQNDENRQNLESTIKQFKDSFIVIAKQLKAITEDVCFPQKSLSLLGRPVYHTGTERGIFENAKTQYFSMIRDSHFNYVKAVTDYLEIRFRAFLYTTTNLAFGEKYFEYVPGKDTKKYAFKNLKTKKNYSTIHNLYEGLTRSQFRTIFLEGGKIKKLVINCMDIPWSEIDWIQFFDLFGIKDITTKHQIHSTFSVQKSDKYMHYCKLAEQITAGINNFVSSIITDNAFVIASENSIKDIENVFFQFGYQMRSRSEIPENHIISFDSKIFSKQDLLKVHEIKKDTYEKVINSIKHKLERENCFIEDLMNIEYITSHYNVSFTEFMIAITYATYGEKSIEIFPWFGSSILIKGKV